MQNAKLLYKLFMLGRANVLITVNRAKRVADHSAETWREYIETN